MQCIQEILAEVYLLMLFMLGRFAINRGVPEDGVFAPRERLGMERRGQGIRNMLVIIFSSSL